MTKLMNLLTRLSAQAPALVADLSEDVYGEDDRTTNRHVRLLIQKLQRKGWQIRFDGKGYRLSETHWRLLRQAGAVPELWQEFETEAQCAAPDALARRLAS